MSRSQELAPSPRSHLSFLLVAFLPFSSHRRAINNGLLDTYQLKSLDGLLEGDLEDLAIVKDKKGKLHITLRFYLENRNTSAGVDSVTLPQDELDNFATRAPYDRVIRCLGWKFDFSIYNR